ncbi:DUF4190 domain-containing protein [Leifsonia sp. 2TAF2]|uniref:DUF4190 domain-containing protein n=1 Tax=Leifsonia sp. 2TAF2 TaxID=3233009 RepID=UPI003F9CCA9A
MSAAPDTQLPPHPASAPAPQQGTNTLSIISLISSFFIGLAGVITGHIALVQIRRSGQSGRGMAIAGLVIGYANILAGFISITVFVVLAVTQVNELAACAGDGVAAGMVDACTY